jgi:hypothetical protein
MGRCRWACRFEIRNSTGKKFKHIRLLNTHTDTDTHTGPDLRFVV